MQTPDSNKVIYLDEKRKEKFEKERDKSNRIKELEKRIIDFFEEDLPEKNKDYTSLRIDYRNLIKDVCDCYGIQYDNPDIKKVKDAISKEREYIRLMSR